ncbi:hypothetical protein D3C71_1590900 [compost metagenome]
MKASHTSVCSLAGFFSSTTASGRPFTKAIRSGRRGCLLPVMVNWFTTRKSLLLGWAKSMKWTRSVFFSSPATNSTSRPFRSKRCTLRLRTTICSSLTDCRACAACSRAAGGICGLIRASAAIKRSRNTTCR